MTGYVRADTDNSIENGQIANASDLDAEFNAIQTAFSTSSGHRHDGTSAEGAPITVVGPVQDIVVSALGIIPKNNNSYDLGSSGNKFKNLFLQGTLSVGALESTSSTVGGDTVATLTATQTLTNKTINLASNTFVATSAQLLAALTDETGTGSVVFSISPALTGTPTAPTAAAGTNTTQVATTAHVFAERTNTATLTNKTLTSPTINTPAITGGSASGLALTGVPTAPTATAGTNTTQVATTAFVQTEIAAGASAPFPSGGIIMWSGTIAAIPSGWVLCNGTSGTPDLRGRMVIGAGGAYAIGDTGGNATITLSEAQLPSHTHTFSATTGDGGSHNHTGTTSGAGAHSHTFDTIRASAGGAPREGVNETASVGESALDSFTTNGVGDHTHTFTTSTVAAHTHSVSGTTGAKGSGSSINILNPYFALAFIMKT